MAKIKYYDIKKTLRNDIPYYMVIGKRSNGKTYSTLKYILEKWAKERKQAVYLRRFREDIVGARGQKVFSDFMTDTEYISKITKGEYSGLHYWNRGLYFCNYSDNGKVIYSEETRVCYFMCLSDVEHDKSTGGYSEVATVVFDEFIARQGYITDEFLNFTNVLSTIIRGKTDVKVIMLGNTISKFCPYFKEMGITHIHRMKQGTKDVYEYGSNDKLKVLVEYTADNQGNKDSDFYFAFDNPKLSMITSGEWELPLYPHCTVKFKNNDVVFRYYIMFSEKIFECQVVSKGDNIFTFIFEKTTAISDKEIHLIYQLDKTENKYYSTNIYKPRNNTENKILWFYKNDKVFYSNNEVGNYIQNYLRECARNG